MIGFLSWRIAPRRAAPIVAGALHPLLVVTAITLVAVALVRTVTDVERIAHPLVAVAAVVAVVVTGLGVIVATDPVRPPTTVVAFALTVAAALAADGLSAASAWGTSNVLWDDWGPVVVGVTILSFSMFRPGRELAAATLVSLAVVGTISAAEAGDLPETVSPLTSAVIACTPVLLLGVAASVFSYRMSLSLARQQELAARAERGLARRVRIRLRELMRDSGRAELSAEVVPFFEEVLARGELAPEDPARARRLSAVLRSEIMAGVGLPWLERLQRARPGRLVVHDPATVAETMPVEQKVALRALLTALLAHPETAGDALHVRVTEVAEHRSVFVRAPWGAGEPAARRALGGFVAVMGSAFGRSQVTIGDGELRLLFAQNPRVTDAGPWNA
ncbi:hypothetical protein NVV95_03855 [Herbiconiux sp. CPCC 205716]|uniref:Signal transduction histidine kinase n=1 Tax=Herbiconiux gentiana TaxID=2970912 RepID=A0ABT2GBV2_9MICO|nr:hypothetical protein [Herbiconiux gentiana]MCS5713684.1 hypothetical protein [Herbiconiux gentiana]